MELVLFFIVIGFKFVEYVDDMAVDLVHYFYNFSFFEIYLNSADEIAVFVIICIVKLWNHFYK